MTDFLITTDYLIHIIEFSLDFINHSYTLWFITALVMFCFELKKKKVVVLTLTLLLQH